MKIVVYEATLKDFCLPEVDSVSHLHKRMKKVGLDFIAAWRDNSPVYLTIKESLMVKKGVLFEQWGCDAGMVTLKISLPNGHGNNGWPCVDDVDENDERYIIAKALRVRQ